MHELLAQIERRLAAQLERLAAGDDLPPGPRLRLEGLLEAAVLTGVATEAELDALLEREMRRQRRSTPGIELGADWRERHPFPQLPLFQRRAPVSPSTSD